MGTSETPRALRCSGIQRRTPRRSIDGHEVRPESESFLTSREGDRNSPKGAASVNPPGSFRPLGQSGIHLPRRHPAKCRNRRVSPRRVVRVTSRHGDPAHGIPCQTGIRENPHASIRPKRSPRQRGAQAPRSEPCGCRRRRQLLAPTSSKTPGPPSKLRPRANGEN